MDLTRGSSCCLSHSNMEMGWFSALEDKKCPWKVVAALHGRKPLAQTNHYWVGQMECYHLHVALVSPAHSAARSCILFAKLTKFEVLIQPSYISRVSTSCSALWGPGVHMLHARGVEISKRGSGVRLIRSVVQDGLRDNKSFKRGLLLSQSLK